MSVIDLPTIFGTDRVGSRSERATASSQRSTQPSSVEEALQSVRMSGDFTVTATLILPSQYARRYSLFLTMATETFCDRRGYGIGAIVFTPADFNGDGKSTCLIDRVPPSGCERGCRLLNTSAKDRSTLFDCRAR